MTISPRKRAFAALGALALCHACSAAHAALEPVDPAAAALRQKMAQAYDRLHTFRERVVQEQWNGEPSKSIAIAYDLKVQRPGRFSLRVDYPALNGSAPFHTLWVSDGRRLAQYNSARNEYFTAPVKPGLDEIALPVSLRGPELALLLRRIDPFAEVPLAAETRFTAASETTSDRSSDILHLTMLYQGARRECVYRLDPRTHLITGYTIDITPDARTASPFAGDSTVGGVTAAYRTLDVNPKLAKSDFEFVPPPGAAHHAAPLPAPK